MKQARLVWFALALWAASATATLALACDKSGTAGASAKVTAAHSCSKTAALQTASKDACCSSAATSAVAASSSSGAAAHDCSGAASATAASAHSCDQASATTAAAQCPYANGNAAVHAVSGECPYAHGSAAGTVTAVTAGAVTAVTAGSAGAKDSGHCPAFSSAGTGAACKGSASASAKTTAHQCEGEGLVKMADQTAHTNCDGCSDMARCEQEIVSAGGKVQVVQLKNGVMYMYTAESSAGVRAVQAAVTHRNERLAAFTTAGDHVHLCDECKSMRGAAASGKLTREVVNIEGGCLTLVTSTDPSIVAKLHAMAQAAGARSKI